VRIREARAADWRAVAALLAELGRPDVLASPDAEVHARLFEAYLERPDTVALVAERNGAVVGFCDVEFRQWLNFIRPQAWIPDLIVTEAARSAGAGAALLARAEELARSRGCWSMALESATWRERAHAFYEREGWSAGGKAFTKLLDDLEWPPAPREG
jgi:GNAT superfamily N-acetyltransferase